MVRSLYFEVRCNRYELTKKEDAQLLTLQNSNLCDVTRIRNMKTLLWLPDAICCFVLTRVINAVCMHLYAHIKRSINCRLGFPGFWEEIKHTKSSPTKGCNSNFLINPKIPKWNQCILIWGFIGSWGHIKEKSVNWWQVLVVGRLSNFNQCRYLFTNNYTVQISVLLIIFVFKIPLRKKVFAYCATELYPYN